MYEELESTYFFLSYQTTYIYFRFLQGALDGSGIIYARRQVSLLFYIMCFPESSAALRINLGCLEKSASCRLGRELIALSHYPLPRFSERRREP
jgi:hypothetical protein